MSSPPQAMPDHPEKVRFPLMESPLVGFLLAFMAGCMNAYTYAQASTFATVQSGNVVSSGYWLIQGNWEKFYFPIISVLCFGLGSAACGVFMTTMLRHGKEYTPHVLFIMMIILVVLAVLVVVFNIGDEADILSSDKDKTAQFIAFAISFVAGAQGNAFHKNHGMLYGNVAVTFVVQMAFNFLVQSFFSKKGINGEPNLRWAGIFFFVLLGFAGGGAIGFVVDKYGVVGGSIFLTAAIAALLGVLSLKTRAADPTPGGLIG